MLAIWVIHRYRVLGAQRRASLAWGKQEGFLEEVALLNFAT